jgi:signal transduction histidine kinase
MMPAVRMMMLKAWQVHLKRALWTGASVALVLLVLWFARLFTPLQLSLSNLYYAPSPVGGDVVLVKLDDASLQQYGRSPSAWDRALYGDLVTQLSDAGARVVAFDLIFSEPAAGDDAFAQAMREARQSETGTRFVMVGAGVGTPQVIAPDGDDALIPNLPRLQYGDMLYPVSSLEAVADRVAFVNAFPDADGAIRRQPLMMSHADETHFGLSVASYLAYLRVPSSLVGQVVSYDAPVVTLGQRRVPIDAQGVWMQDYFGAALRNDAQTFSTVSFVDVVEGRFDNALFDDKIVLVGLVSSQGALDQYPVPSSQAGELMAGVEIQANALESLLQDRVLVTLPDVWQAIFIVVLALGSSFIYVRAIWQVKLALWVALSLTLWLAGSLIFNTMGVVLYVFYPFLAISLPALLMIGQDISREIRRRQRADFLLNSVDTASQQRLALSRIIPLMVADIQRIVPNTDGAFWLLPLSGGHVGIHLETTWGDLHEDFSFMAPLDLLTLKHPTQRGDITYYPLRSQGHLIGVLGLRPALNMRQERLIMSLTQRLAPVLDAAQLYQLADRQRTLLQTILAQSPSPIVVLDKNDVLMMQNDAFAQIMPDVAVPSWREWLEKAVDDEIVRTRIKTRLMDDKTFEQALTIGERDYVLRAAPLSSDVRWILLLNDVTDLVALNQLKTRMIRMASHDLKNPLARINGYVQLLDMSESINAEDREFIGHIDDASDEMLALINDILNLERLRSGRIEKGRVAMRTLVQQIYMRHEPEAKLKRQTYNLYLPDDDKVFVLADFNQLSQVVSNLVNNAIKYTPEDGQIDITLRVEDGDDDALGRMLFEVRDTGYGISPEAQAKLFTEFYRVRTQETAGIHGTGLGLSLVKSVMDAHDGDVGVNSEEGKGSTFYVAMALHDDQDSPADFNQYWGAMG